LCENNQLLSLPDLPTGLGSLLCNNNQLLSLPDLPTGLEWLMFQDNRLTTIPDLPTGLVSLWCDGNQLLSLPNLPANLEEFVCTSNNFPVIEDDESLDDYVARMKAIAEAESRERIVQRCGLVFEELAQTVWHPSRVERLMLAGVDMEDM
jgi:hypothetical protein